MGSVRALYTTGDNDPELYPQQYYRHYLYCDACGSFVLGPWSEPEDHAQLETTRQRLAKGAVVTVPLVVAAAWEALGPALALSYLDFLLASLAWSLCLLGLLWRFAGSGPLGSPKRFWRFILKPILIFPGVLWLECLSFGLVSPWIWLVGGSLLVVALLVARATLGSKIQHLGLRCRQCGATYPYGSSLFTDLDANPRNLTIEHVPRPLGSSPFEREVVTDQDSKLGGR